MAGTISALRCNGTRKHLDLLLVDYYKEYKSLPTDGSAKPPPPPEELSAEDEVRLPAGHPDYWLPPAVRGGVHAREQSRMVNARRTPSGNFFQITNPSLHSERVPSTKPPEPKYMTAAKDMTKAAMEADLAATNSKVAGLETGIVANEKPWLTPQELGDRKEGKKVAKCVSSKRTPTGGFFLVP